MRVKRQKRFRKVVRFYKACFGFREPFKVLCDGNLQHYVLQSGMRDLKSLLTQALGADAKPFTTRCINAELKKLGPSFADTLHESRKLLVAKCNHEPLKAGGDCLESLVGDFNPDHFLVATQDVDLRRKLRLMPGCALIFANKTSFVLEPPSEFQHQVAKADESKRAHMRSGEQKAIDLLEEQRQGDGPEEDPPKNPRADQLLGVRDRPTFKRKYAKGPNPLSCLKSKKKQPAQPQAGKDGEPTKKRHRNRNRKPKETES